MKYLKKFLNIIMIIITLTPIFAYARANPNAKQEDYANVVFFAYFKDDEKGKNTLINNFSMQSNIALNQVSYKDMFIGNYPSSLKNYLYEMSYGKFNVHTIFPQEENGNIVPLELSMNLAAADQGNVDETIIREICQHYAGKKLDSNLLDYNKDGAIDNFTIFLAGGDKLNYNPGSTLTSHQSHYGDDSNKFSDKIIWKYNVLNSASLSWSGASVISHEFSHTIGFPDLYNYGIDHPVYLWDIMGKTTPSAPQMLTYVRKFIKDWNIIDEITTSQDIVLDPPNDWNGNQSYIIKSPFRDYEIFVVEYRKKGINRGDIDGYINKDGVIIYRVDTTVKELSNYHGKTGVYVFRDEMINDGSYSEEEMNIREVNAAIIDQRDKIGDSNMEAKDGILSFSDGSNSGIVITNIRYEGSKMKMHVEIPDPSKYDIWTETNYNGYHDPNNTKESSTGSIINYNQNLLTVDSDNSNIYTNIYNTSSKTWQNISTATIPNMNGVSKINLYNYNNETYLFVSTYTGIFNVYKYVSNKWERIINSSKNINSFSIENLNNKLYIAAITDSIDAKIYEFTNNTLIERHNLYHGSQEFHVEDGMITSIKLLNLNNQLYTIVSKFGGEIIIYKPNGNSYIRNNYYDIKSNSFDAVVYKNNIYIVTNGNSNSSNNGFYKYNGTDINTINTNFNYGFPKLINSGNKLYLAAIESNSGYQNYGETVVYVYNEGNETFTKEGLSVLGKGGYSSTLDLETINNNIYVMVGIDMSKKHKIYVKEQFDKPIEKTLREYIYIAGMNITNNYVRGITLNDSIQNIKNKLTNYNINVSSPSGIITTGTKFALNGETYYAVVKGDINGDGYINSADLLKMRQHLLATHILTGANKEAALLANTTNVNSADLLRLRQHLLGQKPISQ